MTSKLTFSTSPAASPGTGCPESPPQKHEMDLQRPPSPLSGKGVLKRLQNQKFYAEKKARNFTWQNRSSFEELAKAQSRFDAPLDLHYKDLISRFEKFAEGKIKSEEELNTILERLNKILQNETLSTAAKFIQLSLLFYYLERDGELPETASPPLYRLAEIKEEIEFLQKEALPSFHTGLQGYILRAFSNMSFYGDGEINQGGAALVLLMLNGELGGHFKDNQLEHLRFIFQKLISDPNFQKLIKEPLDHVNPDMEKFIRIDCKIPIDSAISPQHIRQFLLLGLLHDLRQFSLPNCYSIATLSFAIRTTPEQILSLYRKLIAEGMFEVNPGINVPVAQLAYDRLLFDPDLNKRIDSSLFLQSSLYHSIRRVLNLNCEIPLNGTLTMWEILKAIAGHSKSSPDAYPLALLVVSSYKRNILQEMVLAQIEFMETNGTQILSVSGQIPRAVKGQFIKFLESEIYQKIKTNSPDCFSNESVKNFLELFQEEIEKGLWLQDCSKEVKIVNEEVIVPNQYETFTKIGCNSKETSKITQFFSRHRRLLYLDGNKIFYIENIEILRNVIRKVLSDLLKKTDAKENDFFKTFIFKMNDLIVSNHLSEALALFLSEINSSKIPLTKKEYSDSGYIGFMQDGGVVNNFPIKTLGISPSRRNFCSALPERSFIHFFNFLYNLSGKNAFLSPKKLIICSSSTHSFLIQPSLFAPLWNDRPPEEVLFNRETVVFSALLKKDLMLNEMLHLLRSLFSDPMKGTSIFATLPATALSAAEFRKFFYSKHRSDLDLLEKFDLALYNFLTQIPIADFSIKEILAPNSPERSEYAEIDNKIREECRLEFPKSVPVLKLAQILKKTLSKYNKIYTISTLERLICLNYKLPLPWIIGDLNWANYEEDSHPHLLILRNVMDKLRFFKRDGTKEAPIDSSLYNGFCNLEILYM
ncbi:MAG: hypothetical protein JJU12_05160 [Chlamydiales bacterium]|nr:hypothetical protein [Chlamydiales bacterium]